MSEDRSVWFLYMIRCRDGQLYTGISTDIERRFAEHTAGKGSKFLRGKAPLELVFRQSIGTHSDALKAEITIKQLSKESKEQIIRSGNFLIPQGNEEVDSSHAHVARVRLSSEPGFNM